MPEQPHVSDTAPPDPHPGGLPVPAQEAAPPDPYASQAAPVVPPSPWAAKTPPAVVKDPALRMEAPPDPYAKRSPALRGPDAGGGGNDDLILAGLGRIAEQNERILRLLEGGARF